MKFAGMRIRSVCFAFLALLAGSNLWSDDFELPPLNEESESALGDVPPGESEDDFLPISEPSPLEKEVTPPPAATIPPPKENSAGLSNPENIAADGAVEIDVLRQ